MQSLIDFISQPCPWYAGGALIGLMVPLLLLAGNRQFGISSSMRHLCAACLPAKAEFFNYDWREHRWNLVLAFGMIIGGFIAARFLHNPNDIAISDNTKADLMNLGLTDFSGYAPQEIFGWKNLLSFHGFLFVIAGGFLVGFGTRYANGCTSGHSIMGMSLLNWVSLVATIAFFAGGLLVTHFLYPLIFKP